MILNIVQGSETREGCNLLFIVSVNLNFNFNLVTWPITRRFKSKVDTALPNYLWIYSQNTTITVETTSIDRITFPLTFIIFSWGNKKGERKK